MLHQLKRLAKHSAIYGIGGLVSRILAVLLLPLYTHYLTRADYGRVETLTAASAVLVIVLRLGISSAFFRFYFDSKEPRTGVRGRAHVVLVHDGDGDRSGSSLGLALRRADRLGARSSDGHANLVRAAAVGLWAQMNYEQLTSLFRVEERSVAVRLREPRERPDHGRRDGRARRRLPRGRARRDRRQLHRHARRLPRAARVPARPARAPVRPEAAARDEQVRAAARARRRSRSGRSTSSTASSSAHYKGQGEVGVYSVGVRISSAIVFMLIAFRTAWPAFAYSIEDDREARRTYAYVLTYLS